ncbi:hypothetical protein G5B38_14010 [Pseudohalocynthiibacter aestuariivivens]|uniref:DUF3899 domain-containing protein n=1 Tax=Roseovarius pelagicus TaxID=2980108 RepID=A0ABY6DFJ5_9RHOB|nr:MULTISPECIES: hypothetical protein [Rhodobacterales]QIE46546.1 hypothetical protein G5B38_14010 [Pseudohalocynthiibacter aestuariivivens]UXX84932.1 hypothetical protein N7U68_09935 [Roseovarius pelagicus]
MLALLRLMVFGFLFLSVIYVALSFYSRSVRTGKLRKQWEEEGQPGERDVFVDAGLKEYDGSVRRKLILLVYIVPITVMSTIIYLTNFN